VAAFANEVFAEDVLDVEPVVVPHDVPFAVYPRRHKAPGFVDKDERAVRREMAIQGFHFPFRIFYVLEHEARERDVRNSGEGNGVKILF